jgi:hypothetical protein
MSAAEPAPSSTTAIPVKSAALYAAASVLGMSIAALANHYLYPMQFLEGIAPPRWWKELAFSARRYEPAVQSIILFGLFSGTAQWLVLRGVVRKSLSTSTGTLTPADRRLLRETSWWIVATMGGEVVACIPMMLLGIAYPMTSIIEETPNILRLAESIPAGAALGAAQWIVLRRHVPRAGGWIGMSSVGRLIGAMLYQAFVLSVYDTMSSDMDLALLEIYSAIVEGIPLAIAQAFALRTLFRVPPAAEMMPSRRAVHPLVRLLALIGIGLFIVGLIVPTYTKNIFTLSDTPAPYCLTFAIELLDRNLGLGWPRSLAGIGVLCIPLSVALACWSFRWAAVAAFLGFLGVLFFRLDVRMLDNDIPLYRYAWSASGLLLTLTWIVAARQRRAGTANPSDRGSVERAAKPQPKS